MGRLGGGELVKNIGFQCERKGNSPDSARMIQPLLFDSQFAEKMLMGTNWGGLGNRNAFPCVQKLRGTVAGSRPDWIYTYNNPLLSGGG